MNGKQAIIDKIIGDANAKAEQIAAEAKAKTDEIAKKAEKAAEDIVAEGEAKKRAAFDTVVANAAVVANLDCKKALLTAKTNLIGGAFDRAAEILRADKKKYCDLVGKMIASSAEDGDKVRVSEADKDVLDKAFVESVAKKRKIKITLDKEYAPIKGGVILVGKNYDKNLSLDLELQTLREECEGEVAKVLFGE